MSSAGHSEGLSRRDLLRLAGSMAGLSGVASCMPEPRSEIRPTRAPRDVRFYSTAWFPSGFAEGLIGKTVAGHPIKVDGNPDHSASLGGSSIHQQALLFELYDPARARAPQEGGKPSTWTAFQKSLDRKRGLRVLLDPSTSPTMLTLLERIAHLYAGSRFYCHSPWGDQARWEGLRGVCHAPYQLRYDLSSAKVIVSIDEDLFGSVPSALRYSRHFADGRRLLDGAATMNRLYIVETDLSVTGMNADHRLPRKPSAVSAAAIALARIIFDARKDATAPITRQSRQTEPWLAAAGSDLLRHRGYALVVAGASQPPEVHALVHAMNVELGAVGKTIEYFPLPFLSPKLVSWDLNELSEEIRRGKAEDLIVISDNPSVAASLPRPSRLTVACLYPADALAPQWLLPLSHPLERWEDGHAADGTLSFAQPLLRPLHDTRSPIELLALIAGAANPDGHELVRESYSGRESWERALQLGFVADTALEPQAPACDWPAVWKILSDWTPPASAPLELHSRIDRKLLDGRFAHNLWLQELPDPVTKLTWNQVAALGPETAANLGVHDGQILRIYSSTGTAQFPALIVRGHAEGAISVPIRVGDDARITRLPDSIALAITQTHDEMEGRPLARTRTLQELRQPIPRADTTSILPVLQPTADEQWGMAIDLTVCTGCSACVIACQAENNIPVVGKADVLKRREMHWIRIDRYYSGSEGKSSVITQPMLCQHCEKAPCEYVCPVNATTHSPDGLNEQTYNRCVGTRFCQNNCPYKVRRFNWFDYNIEQAPEIRLRHNPDVTIRARGVIEKCTYCVQRIREGQIKAREERRAIRDQEIRTACQEACPARAIMFGNIADSTSQVSRWMRQPRSYQVLDEIGTKPRTRYLAKVTNPNPELA